MANTLSPPSSKRSILLPLLAFLAVILLFLWGMAGVERVSQEEQLEVARQAVTRSVIQCYALEGRYPSSPQYLRESYGLAVDEDRYLIQIELYDPNMMPLITVSPREDG